jgi:hypothetical protein
MVREWGGALKLALGCGAVLAVLAGCTEPPGVNVATPSPAASTAVAAPSPSPLSASPVAGGCGRTPILLGAFPDWAASARAPESKFVQSHEGNLIGVLFADPLVAPPRGEDGPNNKILWISQLPRDGADLTLTLTPAGGGQAVTISQPANSGPGEIYPSIVDVPTAGCWSVVAEWAGQRATLELSYQPR